MNVYPVNALEGASLASNQKESYSSLDDLYNRYISYQVDFSNKNIELNGNWNYEINDVSVFIIGNTNAKSGTVRYENYHGVIFEKTFSINQYIEIISIRNGLNKLDPKKVSRFSLTLTGDNNISIGYIYIGKTWQLPRFIINPKKGLQLRNETDYTFSGQIMGIPTEPLRAVSVGFRHIENKAKNIFDDYINGVQKTIPHVVDFYPEAHGDFEPMFMTVANYAEAVKRAENGFIWDFDCMWQEAK